MKKTLIAGLCCLCLASCCIPDDLFGPCGSGDPMVPEACKKMVSCYRYAGVTTDYSSKYGDHGTCWQTTQAAAEACLAECRSANEANKIAYPDVFECQ